MKNNQVVKLLGAITETGKLARDMYDLDDKYYLDSKGEYIPIGQMDYQHTIRSFIKLQDANKIKDIVKEKLLKDLQGGFKQSVDDLDTIDAQEKIIAGLRSQVETLSENIGSLKEQLEEKDQEYMDYTASLEGRIRTLSASSQHWHKEFKKLIKEDK